ncbi:MAG: SagB/ThcOx family dehydrogenase [Chloroflexi bacterium]|nr:SagB/ThcOx family dehydrogenase [Chloroflexota bacterium]
MNLKLPPPRYDGHISLEAALVKRRSIRDFSTKPLSFGDISQLLWAAQGITAQWGGRTAPSGGGLYPLETYAVTGAVENLAPGIYRYEPAGHQLIESEKGDRRRDLAQAALGQGFIETAAIDIVLTAVYRRITLRYGERGKRYALMEIGHVAQNILLEAAAMGLGAVPIGAFRDDEVGKILNLEAGEDALYIIPVGWPG